MKITLEFDDIIKQRRFEFSLQFLGINYKENGSKILIDSENIKTKYKIEISDTSTMVSFRTTDT